MQRRNLGRTSLRRSRRRGDPMRDFDSLPRSLRAWLADAVLPWNPRTARRAYMRAYARTRDESHAIAALEKLQRKLIAQDAAQVWGPDHPAAGMTD